MTQDQDTPATTPQTEPSLFAKMLPELLAPFPAELIGKKPTIYCRACRNSPSRVCDSHRKIRCKECQQNITAAHTHLDFVGHSDVTYRLLQVDPDWSWEPLAYDGNGLPKFDEFGGMWMKLTVGGKTVICYGAAASGKTGPDAIKEVIGDGIRNGAMRHGVGLELWGGKFGKLLRLLDEDPDADVISDEASPLEVDANISQYRKIRELWTSLGFIGDANSDNRLNLTGRILGREITDEKTLTCDEAAALLMALENRVKAVKANAAKEAKAKAKAKADDASPAWTDA